jgi:hypothetical protein
MRCSDVVIRPVRYSILDRALSHFYSHFYQATNSYRYCCSGNQWKRESVTEMIRFPVVYYLHLECVASKLDNPRSRDLALVKDRFLPLSVWPFGKRLISALRLFFASTVCVWSFDFKFERVSIPLFYVVTWPDGREWRCLLEQIQVCLLVDRIVQFSLCAVSWFIEESIFTNDIGGEARLCRHKKASSI